MSQFEGITDEDLVRLVEAELARRATAAKSPPKRANQRPIGFVERVEHGRSYLWSFTTTFGSSVVRRNGYRTEEEAEQGLRDFRIGMQTKSFRRTSRIRTVLWYPEPDPEPVVIPRRVVCAGSCGTGWWPSELERGPPFTPWRGRPRYSPVKCMHCDNLVCRSCRVCNYGRPTISRNYYPGKQITNGAWRSRRSRAIRGIEKFCGREEGRRGQRSKPFTSESLSALAASLGAMSPHERRAYQDRQRLQAALDR